MKKMILVAALTLSAASAFAQVCQVEMRDIRSDRLIQTFTSYDGENNCYEAKKECSKQIRLQGRYGLAECKIRADRYPYPNPQPQPNPYPYPYPNPQPQPQPQPQPDYNYDVRRPVNSGEVVYYNSRQATVIGVGYNNQFALRTTDVWNNTITVNGIRREQLSVTTGCNRDLCVNDSVISLVSGSNGKNATIVALSYDDRFIIRTSDVWNNSIVQSSVDRSQLAITKAGTCVYSASTAICIGDRVINTSNREGTVIGIQQNSAYGDRLVLRTTDVWNNTIVETNVDPRNLYVTRNTDPYPYPRPRR